LHELADELSAMAASGGQNGTATELAHQASGRVHDAASWLEQREPGDLIAEVRGFARRRPGVFVLAAAVAGIVAGRLTRGTVAAQKDSQPGPPAAGEERWATQTAAEPVVPASAEAASWAPETTAYQGSETTAYEGFSHEHLCAGPRRPVRAIGGG
jgi:hypothetical protein